MTPAELYQAAIDDTLALLRAMPPSTSKTLPLSPEVAALLARAAAPTATVQVLAPTTAPVPAVHSGDVAADLATLAGVVRDCEKCSLCKTRTQTVFGVGNI